MIVLLFATQREAQPFIDQTDAVSTEDGDFRCFSLDHHPTLKSCRIVISGVGPESAAQATEYAIQHLGARLVINAGICGATTDTPIGQLFWVEKTFSRTSDALRPSTSATCLVPTADDLKSANLITSETAVFDVDTKRSLAQWADLVEMEGSAIASVCARRNIPCIMLKGVTDQADADGHDSIMQHIDRVSLKIAQHLFASLPALIDRHANRSNPPKTMTSVMQFTKIEHTAFSVPLLFAGARLGGGSGFPPVTTLALILMAALGARVYGMAVNRIFDFDIDRKNPRTANRELPTGALRMSHAWTIALTGLVVYLIACIMLGGWCLYLSPVPLIPLTLYPLLKRFTSLCHFGVGLCLAQAPYGAYIAASGTVDWNVPVILLSLFTFFWLSGSDIVYALLDADFDRQHGVCSVPGKLGPTKAQWVASTCHVFAFGAACAMLYSLGWNVAGSISLGFLAVTLSLVSVTSIPVPVRFFPISALASIAGAFVALLGVN